MKTRVARPAFDLERYLDSSAKVVTGDLRLSEGAGRSLSEGEIRCLSYMMDIEGHTMHYLKALLNTCASRNPDVLAFLSCWVYEEYFHNRALRQYLIGAGVNVPAARLEDVHRGRSLREWAEERSAYLLCHVIRDFHAIYFVWGAIQELTTLEGYGVLARRTHDPVLRLLLQRIIKDERRHFAFYYNQAQRVLQPGVGEALTRTILRRFWTPVGEGVKSRAEAQWMIRFLFSGEDGLTAVRSIDSTIARLPGLEWFDLMTKRRESAIVEPSRAHNSGTMSSVHVTRPTA